MKLFLRDYSEWQSFISAEGAHEASLICQGTLHLQVTSHEFDTTAFPAYKNATVGTRIELFWFSGEHDYFDQEVYERLKAKKRLKYSGVGKRK